MQFLLSALLLLTLSSVVSAYFTFYIVNGFAQTVTDVDMVLTACFYQPGHPNQYCTQSQFYTFGYTTSVEALGVTTTYVTNLEVTLATAANPQVTLATYKNNGNFTSYNFVLVAYTQAYDPTQTGIAANTANITAYIGSSDPDTITTITADLFYSSNTSYLETVSTGVYYYYNTKNSDIASDGPNTNKINFGGYFSAQTKTSEGTYLYSPQFTALWSTTTGSFVGYDQDISINAVGGQLSLNLYIGNAEVSTAGKVVVLSPPLQITPPSFAPTVRPSFSQAPSPIPAPTGGNSQHNGLAALSSGEQAGVILAIVIAGVGAVALCAFCWFRFQQKSSAQEPLMKV